MSNVHSIPLTATGPATQGWVPEAFPVEAAAPEAVATEVPVAEATLTDTPNVRPLRERASCGLNFARFGLIWVIAAIVIAILILFAPLVEALVVAAILLVVCIIENAALGARLAANATVSVATDTLNMASSNIHVDPPPTVRVVHSAVNGCPPSRLIGPIVHKPDRRRRMGTRKVNLRSTSHPRVRVGSPAMRNNGPLGERVTVGATEVRGTSYRPHNASATRRMRGDK